MSFREGECNMLIGASGSGKTVLLNMLIGLFEPDSGEIWYDNQEFTKLSEQEKKLLHQKIGVLFQGSALFDFRTVLGNIMFPMDFLTDWSESERKKRQDTFWIRSMSKIPRTNIPMNFPEECRNESALPVR